MFRSSKHGKLITVDYDFITGLSDETKCYALSEKTVAMLMSLIEFQHWKTRWHSQIGTPVVQDVIDDIASNALKELMLDGGCSQPDCKSYPTNTSKIEWQPQNPFTQPDYTPDGYGVPPFVAITGETITGLQDGDVITDLTRAPGTLTSILDLIGTFLDLLESGLPRFRVTLGSGDGTVKLKLLSVALGGRAVIVHDDDLLGNGVLVSTKLNVAIIETLLGVETEEEFIIERKIEGEGEHHIDVIFIPDVDEELPFVFFGGGLRGVEICGFSQGDDMCCEGQNELLQNLITTQNAQGALTLEMLDDGTPQSFAPNAPEQWDGTPEDDSAAQLQAHNALCAAIKSWIGFVLWEQARGIGAGASVFATLADHFLGHPDRVFTWIPFSIPEIVSDVTIAALSGMINDTEAIERVACCFKKGLRGRPMSSQTLADALNACDFTFPNNDAQIAGIVDGWNNKPENYRAFVRHLTTARANASATDNGCGCCDDGFNWLFDYNFFHTSYPTIYTPPSYTRISENQIAVHTFFGQDPTNANDQQRGFRVYAPSGCCFRVRVVSPSIPWIPPAPNGYNVVWIARGTPVCYDPATGVDLSVFWCSDNFEMRWGGTTLAHPFEPTNQDVILEFDTEGC